VQAKRSCSPILLVCLLLACLVAPTAGWGQQVTASFTGQISDPTGAQIAGAKVTATDTQRGTQYSTLTNQDGRYNLPNIPVGTYTVKVENQGFQTATQSNITLQLNQVAKLDFQLQVGNVATSVEVSAAAPLLQTESTQLGQVIDERTNTTLPLATRNYVQLTLLAPGSVHPDPSSFTNGQTTASSGRPYVNGNREQANNFILDGMDNNQVSDNLVGYAPSVDAIQEFNEITQNAPAEFGNFMGAIVSTTIKSGTNQYHGVLFEFLRNDKLNANTWSNNFSGGQRKKLRWNEFGATLGGPIKRDKLFFFIDYQGQRFDTPPSTGAVSLFTAQERTGDFSQLLQGAKPIQLYNPFDIDPATGKRRPFVNNQIPSALFDPVAVKILTSSAYPVPTGSGLQNNFLNSNGSQINGDQGDAKVDWSASDKDRVFGRYSQSFIQNPSTNSLPLSYNSFANYPTHNGVLDWVRTVSPTIVNEARFGVNYVFVNNGSAGNGLANFPQTVGLPAVPTDILPAMNFSGGFANGIGSANNYQLFADTVIQYEDTMNITKGAHTMHIGFQGWRQRLDTFYSGNNGLAGSFNFDGRFTAGPNPIGATSGGGSGAGEADFLLGLPSSIGVGVKGGTWGHRGNIFAAFFQDDYHVTPNLTVNLGLRWELNTPWVEVKDRQNNFNLLTGEILVPGKNAGRALYNQYNGITNFQPRIGIAWNARKNTVIRTAYTLSSYLEGTGTNLRLPLNPPATAAEQFAQYDSGSFTLPGSTLKEGFLPFQTNTSDPFAKAGIRLWDPNVRPAVSNQWNFTVQQQLANSLTVQAGYVGQRTTHLAVPMPYLQKQLLPNGTVVNSPYLAGNPTLQNEIGQISGTAANGNQSYNALQAVMLKRFSEGLEYSVAYTYSKCMTDSSGYYGSWGGQTTPTSPYWQNLYDKKAEWGPCYYDATHVLSSYATYDLPFGRNRKYGQNMNKVADAIVGGWQVNGILSLHTGFPLTISAGDASGTNSRGSRANCIAPAHVFGKQNAPDGGYQWFDPASYGPAAPGTFGSCGVGTVRGPGLSTLDLSVAKFFPVTEHQRVEFRSEAINFTNTPILNSPNTGLGGGLGLLQGSQGARQIQFALKYHF